MNHWLKLGLIVVFLSSLTACQSLYQNDWTPVKEKDGIRFSLRSVVGSRIPEFKGETTMPGTIQQVLNVLMDVESYPEWVYQCKQASIIDTIGYDQMHIYQVNKIPLLRSRDIVLHGKIEENTGAGLLRVHLNARPNYCDGKDLENCEKVNQSHYLRVTKSAGFFAAEKVSDNTIKVTWQQHINPGGLLPAWLVTSQLDNLVFKTLTGLKQQLVAQNTEANLQ